MALSTGDSSEWQVALYRVLFAAQNASGFNFNDLDRFAGMTTVDKNTIITGFKNWEATLGSRSHPAQSQTTAH